MTKQSTHDRQVLRIIFIEGAANVLVLIAKAVIGLSTGSMAILSDAVHSLTDAANNVVAFFVIRYSSMPADREHPYGHRKFETLAVFRQNHLGISTNGGFTGVQGLKVSLAVRLNVRLGQLARVGCVI